MLSISVKKEKPHTTHTKKTTRHRLQVSKQQPPDLLSQCRAQWPLRSLIKINHLSLSQEMMCRASVGEFGPSPIEKPLGEAEEECGSLLNMVTAADTAASKISAGVIQMWLSFPTLRLLFSSVT